VVQSRFDLTELDAVDLDALRLGAQVMTHKAQLAARPRVEVFFKTLQATVDEEVARRRLNADEKPLVAVADLPVVTGAMAAEVEAVAEDRQLAADYLDLLGTNIRLSEPVRHAVRTLRDNLAPDS